jgi:hypothetical protein
MCVCGEGCAQPARLLHTASRLLRQPICLTPLDNIPRSSHCCAGHVHLGSLGPRWQLHSMYIRGVAPWPTLATLPTWPLLV